MMKEESHVQKDFRRSYFIKLRIQNISLINRSLD